MALDTRRKDYHCWDEDIDWHDEDEDGMPEPDTWRRSTNLVGKFIGIELELESHTGDFQDIIDVLPLHNADVDGYPPDLEEDGSLDDDSGIEIVFPPISPADLRDITGYFSRVVTALDGAGFGMVTGNCGMHMNVNNNGWSKMKKGIFSALINNMPIVTIEKLGGRRLNYYCKQYKSTSRASVKHQIQSYAEQPDNCHAYACEAKVPGRFECRFPAATTDLRVINRLSFFLEYLEDYADGASKQTLVWKITRLADLFPAFMEWLNKVESASAEELHTFLTEA